MPAGATVATGMNTLGVAAVVKDGNYYIPTTHVGSSYGQVVCIRGGNLNGIGIESAVNSGSDVYLTWQYSAKFIAQLLIKHNMTPERVLFHNNFSAIANPPCFPPCFSFQCQLWAFLITLYTVPPILASIN